jgi:hypothetical protein
MAPTTRMRSAQAHALQSRARSQLERSLGALLVARSGRESCPQLGALLAGWDGRMTVLLRKRVNRHAEQCEECGQRRRRELSPSMLLSVLPLVVLPPALRQQVLWLVADVTPDAVRYRARLARRAGRYRADGFPVPVVPVPRRRPGLRKVLAAGGVVAAGVLIVTAMTLAWPARHTAATTGLDHFSSPPSAAATTSASATAAATAAPPATATLPAVILAPGSSPSGASPAPAPTRTHAPTPTPSGSATPGSLTAAPNSIKLAQIPGGPYTGTFTLTAEGGAVASFRISVPAADAAGLVVTPASGSLDAGQGVTVTDAWLAGVSGASRRAAGRLLRSSR